jgi:hypothetical protein
MVRACLHDAASNEDRARLARVAAHCRDFRSAQILLAISPMTAEAPITARAALTSASCRELSDVHFCSECAQIGQFKRINVISFRWQTAR